MSGEVWITGVGLVSCLGDSAEAHLAALDRPEIWQSKIDRQSAAPTPIHPLPPLALERFIPKKGDQRAMGPLMHCGLYAAGLALEQAGLAGRPEFLQKMDLVAAAPCGERDIAADEAILGEMLANGPDGARMNERLLTDLRPTLFLAQLPNLFAGNISIVHGVLGSSRTFMGEEAAGAAAIRDGWLRVGDGRSDLALVGATYTAERPDGRLLLQAGDYLLTGEWQPIWRRPAAGIAPGSAGAFLVLEAPAHARARGAEPLAKLSAVAAGRSRRAPGQARVEADRLLDQLPPPDRDGLAIFSAACGAGPITAEEREWLEAVFPGTPVRGLAGALGHTAEAALPASIALATHCLAQGRLFGPLAPEEPIEQPIDVGKLRRILASGWGHYRGEALALVEKL